jgi:cephalosporin hydroxylase
MPTAWDLLIENSSAASGSTAWEHLNSQEGGGAGNFVVSSVETVSADIDVNILDTSLSVYKVNASSEVKVIGVDIDVKTVNLDKKIQEVCICE